MSLKRITLLGSTGSIGQQTLDVVRAHPDRFRVSVLVANSSLDLLLEQALEFEPDCIVIGDESLYGSLKDRASLLGLSCELLAGRSSIDAVAARETDLVVAAIVGFAGLTSAYEAIKAGHDVAIANKEPLVAAGALMIEAAQKSGSRLLPVDSEHNAIFQCFEDDQKQGIKRIILTASGGPFRTWTKEDMLRATPEQAVAHPNWSMGAKISVDSASMMNKALEIIEAHFLFGMPADQIDVLVHPQSIVHSMVEYHDGSVLAQMGASDMRTPIAYSMGYPERIVTPGKTLDFTKFSKLDFESLDEDKFPSIPLAYECLKNSSAHCIAFNALNEVAVESFLGGRIGFGDIYSCIDAGLSTVQSKNINEIDAIIEFDCAMRSVARSWIDQK